MSHRVDRTLFCLTLNLKGIIAEICQRGKRDGQVYASHHAFEGRLKIVGVSSLSKREPNQSVRFRTRQVLGDACD